MAEETYVIYTANLEESREVQREIATPFSTETNLALYLINSWFIGLLPLECIKQFIQQFHEDLYTELFGEEEEEVDESAMSIDEETDDSSETTVASVAVDDLEHADKLRVYEALNEGITDDPAQLAWFLDQLPKAKKYPYLCLKKGAATHWDVMMEMLKRGKMTF